MADEREVYELAIEIAGEEKPRQAARDWVELTSAIDRSIAVHGLMESQAGRTGRSVAGAAAVARGGTNNMAMGFQQLAAGLEDLQYSVGGAMNNLSQAVTLFGGPAGLATVATLAGVAVSQLAKHWDEWVTALAPGVANPALKGIEGMTLELAKAKKEMEDLATKTKLSLEELRKFEEAKATVGRLTKKAEEGKELAAITGAPSKAEQEAGAGFREAVAASGGAAALDDLVAGLGAQADEQGKVWNEVDRAMTSVREAAEDLFRAAAQGDADARKRITESLAPNSGFAANIRKSSPEQKAADEAAKKQAADETQYADQAAAEQDRETAEYKRRKATNRKRAEDVAGQLFAGPLGREALAGPVDTGAVRAAMEKLGFSGGTIDRRAGQVQEALRRRADDEARKRAAELGTDLGGGRASLAAEADRRASDERLKRAREAAPGIDELLKDAILGTAQAGGSGAAARDALARQLEGRFGAATARGLAGEAFDKAGAEYDRDLIAGRKLRTSQVVDAAALAGSIQQAVGGQDIPKQQLDKLARIQQVLERMSRRPGQDNVARAG